MASFITAGNATNGLQVSSDNTGILELKSGTGSGTTAVTIGTTQNVGIGTSSPGATLEVSGGASNGLARIGQLQFKSSSGSYSAGADGVQIFPFSDGILYHDNFDGGYAWRTGTSSAERFRIDNNGNVLVTSAQGLGYGTGSGGTVTQATSKTTAVTLNKPTGKITMNGAALAANTSVGFLVNNSLVSENDVVAISFGAGVGGQETNYTLSSVCVTGGFYVGLRNVTSGSRSEAIVVNFAIIKGAIA